MQPKPRVSVVIAFHNAERFIAEAIESVRAQTFTAWELLLVDDGSSDGSATAQKYAEHYPQSIRYLYHPLHCHRGLGATRNLGLHHARGEFAAMLDHDDVWMRNKLERQVAILDAAPEAALVCGVSRYWRSWTGAPFDQGSDNDQSLGVPPNRIYPPPGLLKPTLSELIVPPNPSDFMFRRESIRSLGDFEESFTLFEDQAFLVKVYASLPVFVTDELWDLYRIHPDQLCAKMIRSGGKSEAELVFLNWTKEYLTREGLLDAEIDATLRRRMWPHQHPWLNRTAQWKQRLLANRK